MTTGLFRAWVRTLLLQASWNYDRMVGIGSAYASIPRLRRLPALAEVPVIYVSGDTSDRTQLRAEQGGATILHKPFDVDELLETVERALTSRAA